MRKKRQAVSALACVIIAAACCMPIAGERAFISVSRRYVLVVPALIMANIFLDGLLIFRYKLNTVMGGIWLVIIYYAYCRLYPCALSPLFYLSAAAGALTLAMPFTVRPCDDSGLSCIMKYDLAWLISFAFIFCWLIKECHDFLT